MVLRRNAQAVHPGVQRQVDREGKPLGSQSRSVSLIGHGLDELPAAQPGSLLRERVAQNQNFTPDACTAQGHALLQTGHRKGADALRLQPSGHRNRPVAVCVGLDHRHQAAPGSQGGLEGAGVVGESVQIDFPPGAAFAFIHSFPLPSKCGAGEQPRCCRREYPGRPRSRHRFSRRPQSGCLPPARLPRR